MPITAEQMKAALGARRLQDDEVLQNVLDRMIANATLGAIYLEDDDQRARSRMMVLAIDRLREELRADAELPEEIKATEALARSME